jgi:hypothetical protein
MSTMPGPGDPQTWGPPTGHPNDPRTPDPVDDACPPCAGVGVTPDRDTCNACGGTGR